MLGAVLVDMMLVIMLSTGGLFLSNGAVAKDLVMVVILLALYAVYCILYVLYGSVVNFCLALIYLVSFIYVCKRAALIISRMASAIYDMEHSPNINPDHVAVPKRKMEVVYYFRICSLVLFPLLIGGNLVDVMFFSSFEWIPEVYTQGVYAIYFFALLYIFRCAEPNMVLYLDVPSMQPDAHVVEALLLEDQVANDPIALAALFRPQTLCLVSFPVGCTARKLYVSSLGIEL